MSEPTLSMSIADPNERSFFNGWILRNGLWHRRADLHAAGFTDKEIDALHQDPSGAQCHTVTVNASDLSFGDSK